MAQDQSGVLCAVQHHFERVVEDWTPPGAPAQVLFAPFVSDAHVLQACHAILTPQEQARATRFSRTRDRNSFLQRRAFRRYTARVACSDVRHLSLADIRFSENAFGAPFLAERADIHMSFSSSEVGCVAAWSHWPVGVDVEPLGRQVEAVALAERFFTPGEANMLRRMPAPARAQRFLELWCLKEAALKSIGRGLSYGLDRVSFAFHPKLHSTSAGRQFDPFLWVQDGQCAALVLHLHSGVGEAT